MSCFGIVGETCKARAVIEVTQKLLVSTSALLPNSLPNFHSIHSTIASQNTINNNTPHPPPSYPPPPIPSNKSWPSSPSPPHTSVPKAASGSTYQVSTTARYYFHYMLSSSVQQLPRRILRLWRRLGECWCSSWSRCCLVMKEGYRRGGRGFPRFRTRGWGLRGRLVGVSWVVLREDEGCWPSNSGMRLFLTPVAICGDFPQRIMGMARSAAAILTFPDLKVLSSWPWRKTVRQSSRIGENKLWERSEKEEEERNNREERMSWGSNKHDNIYINSRIAAENMWKRRQVVLVLTSANSGASWNANAHRSASPASATVFCHPNATGPETMLADIGLRCILVVLESMRKWQKYI